MEAVLYRRVVVSSSYADNEDAIVVTVTKESNGCAVWVEGGEATFLAQYFLTSQPRELAIENAVALTRMLQTQYDAEKRRTGNDKAVMMLSVDPVNFPKFEIDAVEYPSHG